jgi:hypothetical protein
VQFKYSTKNDKVDSTSLNLAVFYPVIDTIVDYIYVVELDQHDNSGYSDITELDYFFDPKSAFTFLDELESGKINPNLPIKSDFVTYSVKVVRIS